jgi:hypothetical protein
MKKPKFYMLLLALLGVMVFSSVAVATDTTTPIDLCERDPDTLP